MEKSERSVPMVLKMVFSFFSRELTRKLAAVFYFLSPDVKISLPVARTGCVRYHGKKDSETTRTTRVKVNRARIFTEHKAIFLETECRSRLRS